MKPPSLRDNLLEHHLPAHLPIHRDKRRFREKGLIDVIGRNYAMQLI